MCWYFRCCSRCIYSRAAPQSQFGLGQSHITAEPGLQTVTAQRLRPIAALRLQHPIPAQTLQLKVKALDGVGVLEGVGALKGVNRVVALECVRTETPAPAPEGTAPPLLKPPWRGLDPPGTQGVQWNPLKCLGGAVRSWRGLGPSGQ